VDSLGAMPGAELEARVRRLAAEDLAAAATEALRGLGPQVLRYLRSLLRDEELAGDAFSEFAEHLWRGLATFRGDASLRGWAYRLAYRAALDVRGEAWRRRGRRLATGEASRLAGEVRTGTAIRVERRLQELEKLRGTLTVDEQSLLALRIDQGLPWSEIAEVLAADGERVEPAALMKRFERLKERLAKMAKAQGLVD
jgi:RNA polymerase sigma-70 factor, ECF subfamily